MRLIPQRPLLLGKSTTTAAEEAAVVTVAHYGGGLAAGDRARLQITVQDGARLIVNTQSASRVYKQRDGDNDGGVDAERPSVQQLAATVGRNALLVSAPDPVSLLADSVYEQYNCYTLLHPAQSSVAAVDWISAGRWVARGERWQQRRVRTTTELRVMMHNKCDNNSNNNKNRNASSSSSSDSIPKDEDNDDEDNDNHPAVVWVDAQSSPCDVDITADCQWNCYATIVLCGPQTASMVARFGALQRTLCQPHTAVRTAVNGINSNNSNSKSAADGDEDDTSQHQAEAQAQAVCDQLAGRVLLGVSRSDVEVDDNTNDTTTTTGTTTTTTTIHTVRLAAQSNEDVYRLLHHGIGLQVYRERIAASRSAGIVPQQRGPATSTVRDDVPKKTKPVDNTQKREALLLSRTPVEFFSRTPSSNNNNNSNSNDWAAYMLADSALPTGSFAHSAGLEAASQLGLLRGDKAVDAWVAAATRSAVTLSAPLVWASHCALATSASSTSWLDEWGRLDRHAHALLSTNAPACRSSLDQGWSLLRLAVQLQQEQQETNSRQTLETPLRALQTKLQAVGAAGHWATVLGAVAQQLQLSEDQACRLLAYSVARDAVSSSVRLNLLGPAAGQVALLRARASAREALQLVEQRLMMQEKTMRKNCDGDGDSAVDPVAAAMAVTCGCAPVLEAVHPCHDVLATRLFRT